MQSKRTLLFQPCAYFISLSGTFRSLLRHGKQPQHLKKRPDFLDCSTGCEDIFLPSTLDCCITSIPEQQANIQRIRLRVRDCKVPAFSRQPLPMKNKADFDDLDVIWSIGRNWQYLAQLTTLPTYQQICRCSHDHDFFL